MADQLGVDGPPAKRQKIASPALTPGDSGEANFFGSLLALENELPDDLMGPGTDATQNGPKDSHMSCPPVPQDNVPQKHQQLSQLLQTGSTPTPPPQAGNKSIASPQSQGSGPPSRSPSVGISTSVANAVRSPLSNTLSSPPHGALNKGGTPTSHMNNDGNNGVAYSIANSSGSPAVGTLANMNAMSMNVKAMNSQSLIGMTPQQQQQHHLSQIMNGPHHAMGAPGQTRTAPSNLLGNTLNPNQLTNPQQNQGHPGMTATQAQQQMMKQPNGPMSSSTTGGGQYSFTNSIGSHPTSTAQFNQPLPMSTAQPGVTMATSATNNTASNTMNTPAPPAVGNQQPPTADPKKKKVPTATLR